MSEGHPCSHGAGAGVFTIDPTPEIELDRSLRRRHLVLPATLLAATLLYAGIAGCAVVYEHGLVLAIVPAALLVHAFAIVLVHDGAHRSITHTSADLFIANVGAGLILVPFYAEPFRAAHLVHHRHTNCSHDPLWPAFKESLFHNNRSLYMVGECLPLVFAVLALFARPGSDERSANEHEAREGWGMIRVASAFAATALVLLNVPPPPGFVVGTAAVLGGVASLRHWCEHTGTEPLRGSNTFRFPLGMGIGNHRVHHMRPGLSWLALAHGLRRRTKETGPLRCVASMLRDRSHVHYRSDAGALDV